MEIRALFPTPLVQASIDDASTVTALRQAILEHEASDAGVAHSNDGGWQSPADFVAWSGPCGQAVIETVRGFVDRLTAYYDGTLLSGAALDWRVQAWANVNRAGAANHLHFHPGAFWSACLYVDDGGIDGGAALGGAIEFSDPRGIAPLMYAPSVKIKIANCVTAGLGERVFPRTGMVLLFPAWLAHAVTRYTGAGTRVSVTMNFCL
jgi:uncharacterized protein (TIGR02466 family)